MKKKLTREALFYSVEEVARKIPENRNHKAPNYKYPVQSAVMTAFGAFYFQHPSLRHHEETLQQKTYRATFQKLFHEEPIDTAQTVRNILDKVDQTLLIPAFDNIFRRLDRSGVLSTLRFSERIGLLISGDGVDYFSSEEVSCPQCNRAHHKMDNGVPKVIHSHKMFNAGIVHPTENMFIPLAPEFITPQDGKKKQDCEQNAAKRWLESFRKRHKTVRATLQVDALHCNQGFLTMVEEARFHFIATCKPGSNKTLYEWVETARKGKDIGVTEKKYISNGKSVTARYEYLRDVPLRDGEDAMKVNFVSLQEFDTQSGERLRRFEYVTDLSVKDSSVGEIINAGRKRWKVENEGHNTLKNHGYYFDHNYGHGKQHLSAVIATIILLSFLIHTVLRLVGEDGIVKIFQASLARRRIFDLFRHLMQICVLSSWEQLYSTALKSLQRA